MPPQLTASFYWNWHAVPVVCVSTLIFSIGFFIYLQNPRAVSNHTFFLICLCVNFWLYGNALMYASERPAQALQFYRWITFLGVSYVSPCVYFFSTVWLGLYPQQKKWAWAGFLGSAVFYLLGLLPQVGFTGAQQFFWGFYPKYGWSSQLFIVFFFAYFFAAFYNFTCAYQRESQNVRKTQIRLIALAFLISLTGSVDYLPKLFDLSIYPVGFLSVLVWILLVAYSIVRYKLMDIQTAIHKTIMWFLSSIVAILPFYFIVYFTQPWIDQNPPPVRAVFFLCLFIGFFFYFRSIQPRVNHLFRRRRANLQAVLSEFSSELVHLKSLRDLLQNYVRMLRRTLYTRQISVYLRDRVSESLTPAIAKRVRGLKPFALNHPFLTWLEKRDAVVVADLAQGDPETEDFREAMLDYFSKVEAVVALPFVLGGKLIGVTHLGQKEAFRKYSSEEIRFLSELKSSITIAFSNSLQFIAMQESLQKWNEELEKKVAERTKQLRETQAQLVQAEKLATIGTLAGGVAHEINNPLTAVLTNAQILKMTAHGDDFESVELIEEGAKRCQAIIQNLLKYARKTTQEGPHQKVDLRLVIQNVCSLLAYQFRQESIQLLFELDEIPLIDGISNELEQVLTNVLLNSRDAIKAANRDGVIWIKSKQISDQKVRIQVSDNGVGIKNEDLPKVFDPFFTTKEVGAGTGLGLSVSHSIIEKHRGQISIQSQEGMGTTVILDFILSPRTKVESQKRFETLLI